MMAQQIAQQQPRFSNYVPQGGQPHWQPPWQPPPPSSSTIDGKTILYLLIAALAIYLAYRIYQSGLCGFLEQIPGVGTAAKLVCSGSGLVDGLLGGAGGLISGLASGDVSGAIDTLGGALAPLSGVINPGNVNLGSSHNDQHCAEFDNGFGNMKRVAIDGVCQFGKPGHKCFDNNDCIAFENHSKQEHDKRVCWGQDFCTDGVWGKKQGATRLHAPCQGSHDCRDGFYCESGSCAKSGTVTGDLPMEPLVCEGDGYEDEFETTANQCMKNCVFSDRCKAYEYKISDERCTYYSSRSDCKPSGAVKNYIGGSKRQAYPCTSFAEMPWCKDVGEWDTFSGCCALQNEANCGGGHYRFDKSEEFGSTICGGTG